MTNWSPGLAFLLTGSIRVRFEHVDFFASAVTLILRLSSLAWGIRSLEDGKGIQTYNFLAQLSFRKNNVLFKWCQAHQFFLDDASDWPNSSVGTDDVKNLAPTFCLLLESGICSPFAVG